MTYNNIKLIFIIYNITIIIIFSLIYYFLSEKHFHIEYDLVEDKKISYIDCINLSITIQSTVGLPSIKAKTKLCRFIVTLQQFLLIISFYIIFFEYNN